MRKTTLYITLLFFVLPFCGLAQYGGGNGNGEVFSTITTTQLDGTTIGLYDGGNGRGEISKIITSNQLDGTMLSLYGGGNGRGEIIATNNSSQLDGATLGLYGGGNGRGEILMTINTRQLNGDSINLYVGGNGRGEVLTAINTKQLDGTTLNIYGGGNGRGEILSVINTLQLDGLQATLYMGGNGRGETVSQRNNTPLPIKLMSFGAALVGKEVKVQWQTANEINSSSFAVEKSTDGTNWQLIGTVKAAGNSNTALSYQLFDIHPAEGINYYRLKPTDLDGHFTYSSVATINYQIASPSQITIYPNPATYQFTVLISGLQNTARVNMRLLNTTGETILEKQNISGSAQTFDISRLAAGTYYLVVDNNGKISTAKIIKQ